MLSLLRLHWTANRRILAQILPLFAFWGFALYAGEAAMRQVAIHYFSLMVALTLSAVVLLQGLNTPLEPFLLALPVRRAQVVSATYGVALGAAVVGVVVPVAVHALVTHRPPEWAVTALILGFLATGILAFLPLRFALGGTKGLTVFAGILLAGGIGLYLGSASLQDTLAKAAGACAAHPVRAAAGLLAFGVASFAAACAAYGRREF